MFNDSPRYDRERGLWSVQLPFYRVYCTMFGTTASGLVVGLIPAWRASRAVLTPELARQGGGVAGSSRMFARHALVVTQTPRANPLATDTAGPCEGAAGGRRGHIGHSSENARARLSGLLGSVPSPDLIRRRFIRVVMDAVRRPNP